MDMFVLSCATNPTEISKDLPTPVVRINLIVSYNIHDRAFCQVNSARGYARLERAANAAECNLLDLD